MNISWPVRCIIGLTVFLSVFFPLTAVRAIGAQNLHSVTTEGRTDLALRCSSGKPVRVIISQSKIRGRYSYKDALLWGGDVGDLPKTVLTSIKVSEGNETIFVPLSGYSDLGDVKSASLDTTAKGFVLHIHGGNTATAYDAVLIFDQGYLVSRKVVLREFPDQRWEKTTYSFTQRSSE